MTFPRLLLAAAVVLAAPLSLPVPVARAQTQWRQMVVRSEEEYNQGLVGGENTQHFHSTARSESNPDVIYMAQDVAQIWRSADAGLSWQKPLGAGLHAIACQSVEVDPVNENILFLIMDETYNYLIDNYQGVYRSTDGGESWVLVLQETAQQSRLYQHCLEFDPASKTAEKALRWYAALADDDPSDGYSASPDAAVYRSEDGGTTWTKGAGLADHYPVHGIHCHPTDGQTLYLASDEGLFTSTDRGATIQPLGNLPAGRVSGLQVNPQNGDELWAVLWHGGLYHSTNGGQTFSLVKSSSAAYHVFLNPGHPEVLYFVPEWGQAEVSSNGGSSWTSVTVTPPPGLDRAWKTSMNGAMAGVVADPRDAAKAAAYYNAEFWRTDNRVDWVDSSSYFTGYASGWWADGWSFDVADPDRWVMFCADVSTVRTENNATWFTRHRVPYEWYQQGLIPWIGCYAGDIQPVAGSPIIVAAAGMYWNNKLIRSTDNGATWSIVSDQIANYLMVAFHPAEPTLCFSHNKRSTDAGATWQDMTSLTSLDPQAMLVGMCPGQPDTMYAVRSGLGKLFRTDDRGDTWREVVDVSWRFNVMDSKPTFAVHPTNPDLVYTLDSTGDLAAYDGTSWTSLDILDEAGGAGPFTNYVRMVAVDPRHPEIIYAQMHTPGLPYLYRSTDAGATWTNISANLSQCGGGAIFVNPHTGDLLHGSAFGTWVYPPPYDSPNALYWKLGPEFSISSWQVVADHGPAGILATTVADNFTEARLSGLRTLRVQFTRPVDPATLLPGAVTITGQTGGDVSPLIGSLSLDEAKRTLTIALSATLPDADVYTITITSQLKDFLGASVTGDPDVAVTVLAGDVDGSGSVTQADMLAVREAVGQVVDAERAPKDIDQSGTISAGDMSAVRRRLGNQLP